MGCWAQHKPGLSPITFKGEAPWTQTLALLFTDARTSGRRVGCLSLTVTFC